MQFRLPQFLDIEDKIFGPFTLKQFGYMLGALAFAYLWWKIIPVKIIAILFILIFSGTFLALAFLKVNGRNFPDVLESAYKFFLANRTYIWQKEKKIEENKNQDLRALNIIKKEEKEEIKVLPFEKIKELSGKLDILEEEKEEKINLRQELMKKQGKYQI